jgi:predicted transcriptional regulator
VNIIHAYVHINNMSKKNSKKIIEKILDGSVSANECTGLLQHIETDPEEIEKIRKQYFDGKGE